MASIEVESLATKLQDAGISHEKALVYLRLLAIGPTNVGHLSQYFPTSRSTLYRLLDELAQVGFVTKSLGRPTVYTPVGPEQIFERAVERIHRARTKLIDSRDQILPHLKALASESIQETPQLRWRRIVGARRIYETIIDLSEDAQRAIWVLSNHEISLSRSRPVVNEAWRSAARRAAEASVDVRLLLDLRGQPPRFIPRELPRSESLRIKEFSADQTMHFIVVDHRELIVWVHPTSGAPEGGGEEMAVRTDAPGSVAPHRMLFERLWDEGSSI